MVNIVSQHRLGLIKQHSRFFRTSTSVDDLLQQIRIIAACGFDEKLAGRGTLEKLRLAYILSEQRSGYARGV